VQKALPMNNCPCTEKIKTMQTHIGWKGLLYHSVEDCHITSNNNGTGVNGVIKGFGEGKNFAVDYFIQLNQRWETLSFEIKSRIGEKNFDLRAESNGEGKWTIESNEEPGYDHCFDIDISLTPFTNTLPIKRLMPAINEKHRITVLYIDVLKQETRRIDQLYTKLSDTTYKYENTINDFSAILTVDDAGLVVHYPGIFTRTGLD